MEKEIAKSFNHYFDLVPATTEALKESVYRLRYQVFCVETGFLSPELYPEGLEKDEYDAYSEHSLIRHRKTSKYAATTRLILPDPHNPKRPFPIEKTCPITRNDLVDKIPRHRLAEVSRFCIVSDFKRRPGEKGTVAGEGRETNQEHMASELERRTWPHLTIALIACLHKMNVRHDTTHWFSLVEPSFHRLLSFFGIHFIPIGPLTQCHHRIRQPCIIQTPEYLDVVKQKHSEVWDMVTDHGRFWRDNGDDKATSCDSVSTPPIIRPSHA